MELLTDGLIRKPRRGDIIVTTGVACETRGYTITPTTPFGGIFAFFCKNRDKSPNTRFLKQKNFIVAACRRPASCMAGRCVYCLYGRVTGWKLLSGQLANTSVLLCR